MKGRYLAAGGLAVAGVYGALTVSATPAPAVTAASFRVTLSGRVQEELSYRRFRTEDGCRYRVVGSGARSVVFRSARPSLIRVTPDRFDPGLVRFPRNLVSSLSGTLTEAVGSATSTPQQCTPQAPVTIADCFGQTRRFRSASARVVNPDPGVLELTKLRHPFFEGGLEICGLETTATDPDGIELAPARISARTFFNRRIIQMTVRSVFRRTETDNLPISGLESSSYEIDVRWTLTFRRVGRR